MATEDSVSLRSSAHPSSFLLKADLATFGITMKMSLAFNDVKPA